MRSPGKVWCSRCLYLPKAARTKRAAELTAHTGSHPSAHDDGAFLAQQIYPPTNVDDGLYLLILSPFLHITWHKFHPSLSGL